jgi:SagB-type dehydrogenase family enzyme
MSFLTSLHSHLRRTRITKQGATHRAEDVPRGRHKSYPRMPRLLLPQPQKLSMTLDDAIAKRQSARAGDNRAPISLSEFGTLFGVALRKHEFSNKRRYPSGGALFPVETYLISTAIGDEAPGVFHYNPDAHSLERLLSLPAGYDMKQLAKSPEDLPLSSLMVFTSVWERSSAKYGYLAYQHALIESGHMSENILLVATALGINVRPYAGFNDTLIAQLLDLDEGTEQSVHSVTLCSN